MKFTELNINDRLLRAIEQAGFTECLPVQEKTFVHTFDKKDVNVQSQTGTGKTAAFLITILHLMLQDEELKKRKALIIAPTRELAEQIGKEAQLLGKNTGINSGTFYGGVGYTTQEKMIKDGTDIIIGTPGRLIDLSESGKLDISQIGILVIDEADRLLDMGFLPDIKRMLMMMPSHEKRQTMLYSATLDNRVRQIASEFMNEAIEIEIDPEQVTVENIEQKLYHVGTDEKMELLLGVLKSEKPKNAIIFTNTKHMAIDVSKRLEYNGYKSQYLIGDLPQKKRQLIIDQVKANRVPFLVATDVASRGLHVDDLEMVINYDLPENTESYVHRIGRTARVGKKGKAISLVCNKFVYGLEAIEEYTREKIPVEFADDELFEKDSARGMTFNLKDRGRTRSNPKNRGNPRTRRPADKERHQRKRSSDVNVTKTSKHQHKNRKNDPKNKPPVNIKSPGKNSSIDERLEYYKKKYGEDFSVVSENTQPKTTPHKKSFLKRVKSIFKR